MKLLSGVGKVAGVATLAFLCSCSSMGTRISNFQDIRNSKSSYVVLKETIDPNGQAKSAWLNLIDAYDVTSNNVLEMKCDGLGGSTPQVYSIKPGLYRLEAWAEKKPNFFDLLSSTVTYLHYRFPYFLDFVITIKPGQIVYLGDFTFSRDLSLNYDLDAVKREISQQAPYVQGFEWVSLFRNAPTWAKDLGTATDNKSQ